MLGSLCGNAPRFRRLSVHEVSADPTAYSEIMRERARPPPMGGGDGVTPEAIAFCGLI